MGKRQSKENLRSQEIITLDSLEHYDFSTLKELSNESLRIQFRAKIKKI